MTTQSDTTGGTVARWYIVHTYSGQEDRVQKNLEQRVSTMDVKDKILNVVVPTEEEVEISEGERKTVQKKMYAGYLICLFYTSPSPRDLSTSRMPSSA